MFLSSKNTCGSGVVVDGGIAAEAAFGLNDDGLAVELAGDTLKMTFML